MTATIYTKPNCPYCVKAKELLTEKNIKYNEIYVGTNGVSKEDIQNVLKKMGVSVEVRTVPQIIISNEYVGGYTDLVKYFH